MDKIPQGRYTKEFSGRGCPVGYKKRNVCNRRICAPFFALRQEIRSWRLQLKSDKSIEDLSRMFSPVIQGWINYYGRFYRSAFRAVADRLR